MSNICSVRDICMFDLSKAKSGVICSPNISLIKRDGDFCRDYSYCCVICPTRGCTISADKEKWGFKRTLLRMKLNQNAIN